VKSLSFNLERTSVEDGGARFLVSLPIALVETTEAVGGQEQEGGEIRWIGQSRPESWLWKTRRLYGF